MQSADIYNCIAAHLPPSEQWVLRQVCTAWRHHFRKRPPQLCLVVYKWQWLFMRARCPSTLLPQVRQGKAKPVLVLRARCSS